MLVCLCRRMVDAVMNTEFPAPTANVGLKVNIDRISLMKEPDQTNLLLERISEGVRRCEGADGYDQLLRADLKEYVHRHLSVEATQVHACAHMAIL